MTNRTPDEDFLADFADPFEYVRWKHGGRGFTACCPVEAHDDQSPSLSVDLADDGPSLLVHCFGGCEVEEVLDALGLTFRDLYNGSMPRASKPPRRNPEDAKWERVAERALEQQWREAQPWYWQYRAAICEWAGLKLEARNCLVHAALLEEGR